MENIYILLIGIAIAAYMGRKIIPKILVISMRKRLFDVPDERKVHKRPVPRLGGVTFYPVILFVLCMLTSYRVMVNHLPNNFFTEKIATEVLCLFAGLTLLYLVGIGDDLVGIRYRSKFKIQILAAILFPIAGLYINNFYGLMGIHEVTPYIGIPLTVVLVVFITNAINLIDGIDGLASSICIVALSVFGILFAGNELWLFAQLAFTCVGVLIPFFMYNVFGNADRGRKIFMGDTGSLTLGYILSFLVIKYCMYTGPETLQANGSPILIAFSILLVPCLDVIRVVLGRIRRGKNPFMPDKTHIH
ncbi:MAG: undecaprenyl/decaprenyl-phosphate alpha-N-acetylglucosaminyl 1-phosphate transferase, partial [Bacteroides sp.]|nr:undecaprenyl/decaprenyl-phosphate alpha-N-acetylglucosaminyl 1-phosphate transferase [Bacteroides sp.]